MPAVTPLAMPLATPSSVSDLTLSSNGAMVRENIRGTGVYSSSSILRPPGILWKFLVDKQQISSTVYGRVGSTPAISDAIVYIGGDEWLYAVDAITSKQIWTFDTPGGAVNSAAVAGGIVYFSSGDQTLYAADARTGAERWRFTIEDPNLPWSAFTNPVVAAGVVYVGSERDSLFALDAITGHILWRTQVTGSIARTPAIADGMVFVGTQLHPGVDQTFFYGVDALTGRIKWRMLLEERLASSPAVVAGTVYFAGSAAGLYAVDAQTGSIKWRFSKSGSLIVTAPAVAYDTVYITLDYSLYAIDTATGQERWRFEQERGALVSPSIAGDIVYFPVLGKWSTSGAQQPGTLYAVGAHSGKPVWSLAISGSIDNTVAIVDDVVYMKGDDGYLYALR
ncbi:MAG: PQQ-binding-like beta-propeller repeat protein [Chloroflexota bacterium]